MSTTSDVRVAVIGLGNMGTNHANAISAGKVPGLELSAVCDAREERLREFSDVTGFRDAAELLKEEIGTVADAVIIATPHFAHTSLGVAALEKGYHTLVEKPISVHKTDCEKLITAHAKRPDLVFAAMFNQRTDPRYQKIKWLIDSGELGALQRVNWIITDWFRTERYYASGGWRATWSGEGGGVLLNQSPHQLDLWQWLFGMPHRVTARCQFGRFHNIEVEDSVTALLEYQNGVQGVFITTTGESPGTNRLEVAGERGKIVLEGGAPLSFERNEVPADEFSRISTGGFTKPDVWRVEIPICGEGGQHLGVLKNFASAIRGEEKLIAPGEEGIHSVELANAMILSSLNDAAVVLPMDSAEYANTLQRLIRESTFVKERVEEGAPAGDFDQSF